MHYTQLAEYLPDYFDMLLLASTSELESAPHDMVTLTYPIRPNDLASTVEMMLTQLDRRLRKRKSQPKKRTEQEQNYINNAKLVADGKKSYDRAGGVPLYSEKQHGFRHEHG